VFHGPGRITIDSAVVDEKRGGNEGELGVW